MSSFLVSASTSEVLGLLGCMIMPDSQLFYLKYFSYSFCYYGCHVLAVVALYSAHMEVRGQMELVLFFTMWVSGIELREAGLVISAFIHSVSPVLSFCSDLSI